MKDFESLLVDAADDGAVKSIFIEAGRRPPVDVRVLFCEGGGGGGEAAWEEALLFVRDHGLFSL